MTGKPCKPGCQCRRHVRTPEAIALGANMLKLTNEGKRRLGIWTGSLPCPPNCQCRKHIPRKDWVK